MRIPGVPGYYVPHGNVNVPGSVGVPDAAELTPSMRKEVWTARSDALEIHVAREWADTSPPGLPPVQNVEDIVLLVGRPGEALAEVRGDDLRLLQLALDIVAPRHPEAHLYAAQVPRRLR